MGQFAKRSGSDLLKIPYPPHEDQLEQQRTEQSLLPDVQALPGFLELIGNLSAQDAVCKDRVTQKYYERHLTPYRRTVAEPVPWVKVC